MTQLTIYFTILSDACAISEENMKKNNIPLRFKNNEKFYIKPGNTVEFHYKLTYIYIIIYISIKIISSHL